MCLVFCWQVTAVHLVASDATNDSKIIRFRSSSRCYYGSDLIELFNDYS